MLPQWLRWRAWCAAGIAGVAGLDGDDVPRCEFFDVFLQNDLPCVVLYAPVARSVRWLAGLKPALHLTLTDLKIGHYMHALRFGASVAGWRGWHGWCCRCVSLWPAAGRARLVRLRCYRAGAWCRRRFLRRDQRDVAGALDGYTEPNAGDASKLRHAARENLAELRTNCEGCRRACSR